MAHDEWAWKIREFQDEARSQLVGLEITPEHVTALVAAARPEDF